MAAGAETDPVAGEIVPAVAAETDREAGETAPAEAAETDPGAGEIVPAGAAIDRAEVSAEQPLWGLAAEIATAAGRLLTEPHPTKTQMPLDNRAGLASKRVVLPAVTACSPEAATSGSKKADRAAAPTRNQEPVAGEIRGRQRAEPDSPARAELRAPADRFSKRLPI